MRPYVKPVTISVVALREKDDTLKLWDSDSGLCLLTLIGHMGKVKAAAWSPDGARLLSASWDGTIRLWEAHTGAPLARFDVDAPVRCAVWSPDGQFIAAGDWAAYVHVFRLVG